MRISCATITRWLFPEESDNWLSWLRIGLGTQVIFYCVVLRGEWNSFLAGSGAGLLDRRLPEIIVSAQGVFVPQVRWLVLAGSHVGLSEQRTLDLIWLLLLLAGISLAAGLCCRTSAVLAWFLHLAAAKSGGLFAYGVDNFMTIGLFYLMLAPLPDRRSLDAKIWKERKLDPGLLGFFRRILQLHLCVIYFFGGLTKSLGGGWWNGSNLWRALTRPSFGLIPPEWLVSFSYLLIAGGIAVWIVELAYPVLIWREKTRTLWLLLVCAMHAAIGLLMGMYLFGLIMIILNVAAFGPPMPRWTATKTAKPITA